MEIEMDMGLVKKCPWEQQLGGIGAGASDMAKALLLGGSSAFEPGQVTEVVRGCLWVPQITRELAPALEPMLAETLGEEMGLMLA